MDALVTTDWLADALANALADALADTPTNTMDAIDLRIVDASYFADGQRDAAAEYDAAHIPGAVFLDLAELVDESSALPMMLPAPEKFASHMQSLGLADGSRIVLYDNAPLHTAARAWWMLRRFGAHDVAMLDGGLAKWQAEGRDTDSGTAGGTDSRHHRRFTVRADHDGVRTLAQVQANIASGAEQLLDARSSERFSGAAPDPRPATQAGHIPGSKNLPYTALFKADGTWKRGDALRAEYERAGINLARPVITTCGSGITAAVLAFGAYLLGNEAALYDGSWSEWGAQRDTPKATGNA